MSNYGLLINKDAKLHRAWFIEMTELLGINVIFRKPKKGKHYTTHAELESNYEPGVAVGCIFENHPDQKTLKKLGWVSELDDGASIIHVPYDLPVEQGALFLVPSGLDHSKARLFRVVKMQNSMIYPASITCEIVPQYEDNFSATMTDYDSDGHPVTPQVLNDEQVGPTRLEDYNFVQYK